MASDELQRLIQVAELVARGAWGEVQTLLAMAAGSDAAPDVARLAEAFGLMVVKLEAREFRLEQLVDQLLVANLNSLELLGSTIAKRDSDTGGHNYRVSLYAARLGEAVGLDRPTMRGLIKGAFLHDIGKIAIPDAILLKPGRLTPEEFEIMKTHVDHGVEIARRSAWLADAVDVVQYHHEKYDGSGYRAGLAAEDIPITGRIFAIADVFDALASKRPYKEPMPLDKALAIIADGRGSHFDPSLVDSFLAMAPELYAACALAEEARVVETLHAVRLQYFAD